jgi:DNA-directed RNA polymerase specialized sigma24 family protein
MLREVIEKLPAQYRIVLVPRDMEGLTDDEVAEITGFRAGTVRSLPTEKSFADRRSARD